MNSDYEQLSTVVSPKSKTFLHTAFLSGYAAIEITVEDYVDPDEIHRVIGRGDVLFGKYVVRGFTCGPMTYRGAVVGHYRIVDLAMTLPPPIDWTVGYYPDDGEFFEIAPSGNIHY